MNEDRGICEPIHICVIVISVNNYLTIPLIFALFKGILLNIKVYMPKISSVHFGEFSHQKQQSANIHAM